MRFTLALNDYYDQAAKNLLNGNFTCPVCYEEELQGDLDHDAIHIKRCYMLQRIEIELEAYIKEHGKFPKSVRDDIISKITTQVKPDEFQYTFLS